MLRILLREHIRNEITQELSGMSMCLQNTESKISAVPDMSRDSQTTNVLVQLSNRKHCADGLHNNGEKILPIGLGLDGKE